MINMKAIELTESHKEKLLEMIKILFPEYLVPTIQPNGYINIAETEDSSDYVDLIHWFEFCMTHLQNQILIVASNLNKSDVLEYEFFSILTDSWYESHPIDFLYEEFKKLK